MRRNSHEKARRATPKSAEDVLRLGSSNDVLYALERIVRCRDSSDYQQMPALGRLITALFQITVVADAEGIIHYVLYSGDRLHDAKSALLVIGATKKAGILTRIEEFFPGGRIPDSEGARWEALIDDDEVDEGRDRFVNNVSQEWHLADEDVPALLTAYLQDHRAELDQLIMSRTTKTTPSGKYVPMNDEEIIRLSYANEVDPFVGHEIDLVDFNRLPVLMRLVNDPSCPARESLFGALYGISASMASEILSGKTSSDFDKVKAAINEGKRSGDEQVREWAHRSEDLLAKPDAALIMEWMGSAV